MEKGAAITPEAAPEKEGYTFSGWSETPGTMPAKDVTVTGTFTINKYKLTYYVDEVAYKSYEVEFGATITAEAEPTKGNMAFSGWSEIPETMPDHDVIVKGEFVADKQVTIQDAACGRTILTVKPGQQLTLAFEAETGWKLNSVTLNDVDMTSQLDKQNRFTTPAITTDAVLRVVYEQLNTRAVDTEIQNLSVRAVKGGVIIDNANEGSVCQVFLTSGVLLKTVTIKESSDFVSLSEGQTYIVNVGGKTLKVAQ